jgi:hypothetical protein
LLLWRYTYLQGFIKPIQKRSKKQMTQKHDINLKGGTSADFYSYDCADPVQSNSRWKIFSRCGGQLHLCFKIVLASAGFDRESSCFDYVITMHDAVLAYLWGQKSCERQQGPLQQTSKRVDAGIEEHRGREQQIIRKNSRENG